MARLFLVFGTQGAGKSTVLQGIKSVRTVNMGDEMLKSYSKRFGIKHRDEIRKKSLASYNVMVTTRNAILTKIAGSQGDVAIDTHASIKKDDSYALGLSTEDLSTLKNEVKAIIYIDAATGQIIARRKREQAKRKRERDSAQGIDLHRTINMAFSTVCALYLEVPIYVIQNNDGKLAETQRRVAEIIKGTK